MATSDRQVTSREPFLRCFAWVLFAIAATFILYPLFCVLRESVRAEDGAFTLAHFVRIFSAPYLRSALPNTLILAVCVACTSTLVGFGLAYAVTRTDLGGRRLWNLAATIPMIAPSFLVALSAIALFGNNGFITRWVFGEFPRFSIYGFGGLWFVETLAFFPTAYLVSTALLGSIDPSLEDAALNSGASRLRTFWTVTFPLSLPAIWNSLLLVFIESLADFGHPLILSGGFKVLSVEAYLRIVGTELDLAGGAAMALLLLIPALAAFLVQHFVLAKTSYVTVTGKPSAASFRSLNRFPRIVWWSVCLFVAGTVFLLYGTVLFASFIKIFGIDNRPTLEHYRLVFSTQSDTIQKSILLAAIAAPISGFFGMAVAYIVARTRLTVRKWIEWTSLLTFAVPGTVVGIGYVLAFNEPPLMIQGTWMAIVLLFVFRNAPLGIRAGIATLFQIERSIEEASQNLGASRWTTIRRIVAPLMIPAFLAGLSFAFIRCLNSISAVIFVVSGKWNLITVSILNLVENGRLSAASALCVILVLIVISTLALLHWVLPSQRRRRFAVQSP